MGLCDRRNRKRADGGGFHRVPGKQKKPGKPTISGFPGIDTKKIPRVRTKTRIEAQRSGFDSERSCDRMSEK